MCFTTIVIVTFLQYTTYIGDPTSDTTALYSMMHTTNETVSSAVFRVTVRLPPFWPNRPAIWFAQAEVQFELASITHQ